MDEEHLLGAAAHQGDREQSLRVGRGFDIDGEGAKFGPVTRKALEGGVAKDAKSAAILSFPADAEAAANAAAHEIAVGEAHVGFEDGDPALQEAIAEGRNVARDPHHHLGDGEIAKTLHRHRLDGQDAAIVERIRRFGSDVEVGPLAIVFDEKTPAVFEATEYLDDRSLIPDLVAGVYDEALCRLLRHG